MPTRVSPTIKPADVFCVFMNCRPFALLPLDQLCAELEQDLQDMVDEATDAKTAAAAATRPEADVAANALRGEDATVPTMGMVPFAAAQAETHATPKRNT
jgi:hypothetical protein